MELVVEGDGYTGFSPTFSHLEDVCMQALQQCVSAAASIPRVGNTPTKGNPTRKHSDKHIHQSMHVVHAVDPTQSDAELAAKALRSPS